MTPRIVWSEAARALFALSGPTAVSAGAGSGKTTCLVELCVRLLAGEATGTPCDPGEIVAITFTEKAATELEDRLREAVMARAAAAAPGCDEARAWRMRLHALDRMAIGTIHGFARRLLREHAIDAGLDPDLDVIDEESSRAWRRDAARSAVLAALDAGRPEAQLLVAAHGTGGRRAGLADVIADLARERATLGETQPMEAGPDRLDEALAARTAVHGAAVALLAVQAEIATATGRRAVEQLAAVLRRLDRSDRTGPLRPEMLAVAGELASAIRSWRAGKSDGERARALKDELGRCCETFLPIAAEALCASQRHELCALVLDAEARYRQRKQVARALDFDDLLVATRDLLRSPGGPRSDLRQRLRALLVDEYQDVNRVQQEIFELLTADPAGTDGALLVAVGDVKQSIYRFRGADVAVFRDVLARFGRGAGARVLHLSTNHRSSPPILDLVNAVSSSCMQPIGAEPREYEIAFGDADRLVPARTGGQSPPCEILEDGAPGSAAERRQREASAIAARIQGLLSGAVGIEVRERAVDGAEPARRPRPGDIAILFRRLTQIGEYERALREAGIPYRLARGGGFYQAPEVRDLGELLATVTDPEDAAGWAALLRSPFCGLSDGALFAVSRLGLRTLARRTPEEVTAVVLASDQAAAGEADRIRRFLDEWHGLRALRDRVTVADLLSRAVDRLDVEAAQLAAPDGERRVANVRKAIAIAARFAERGGTAAGYAERLRTMAREAPREPEAELDSSGAVALLSIHQAKGLEWPIVFVPDMGAQAPRDGRRALRDGRGALAAAFYDATTDVHHTTRSLAEARDEASRASAAESRRLLYVALTRARDRLVLSGESGRGGESWRGLVEAAVAEHPELVVRIPLAEATTFSAGPAVASDRAEPQRDEARRTMHGDPGRAVVAGPPPVTAVRIAVTQLAEHARCPRRVFLRQIGVPERGPAVGRSQDDPDRAAARGTLAHAMLAEVDPCASPLERRAQISAAAARRGYDPRAPGVRRIMADVWRFLESPAGRGLTEAARRGALSREIPFVLRLGGDGPPSCYLVGAIDALLESEREIAVIDFKYAIATPGAADRYRWQLLAYAAAAARALPARRVTARLQFLRGGCQALDVTPTDVELRRFVRDVPRLAVAAHLGHGGTASPAELGRDQRRCSDEGCGFTARCYR